MRSLATTYRPFFLVLGAICALLGLHFAVPSGNVPGIGLKVPDLISNLRPSSIQIAPLPAAVFHDTSALAAPKYLDTIRAVKLDSSSRIVDYGGDSASGMVRFSAALRRRNGKVRVAHFGDSMIEADLVTQDLRRNLQTVFGGGGVGFVPITSEVASMRSTLRVTCSDNWETGSIMDRGKSKYSFGIAGRYFEPAVDLKRPKNGDTTRWVSSGASWVAFQPWRRTFDKSGYAHLSLYVQNVSGFTGVEYSCDDDSALTDTIPVGAGLQRVTLETPADEKILLRFHCSSPFTVDGVSFDSDTGVIVDNFPSRGNGGLALNRISDSVLTSYARFLDYRLIILEYGANIATDDTLLERTNYERVFTSVIRRLRSDFPNADVLVIGAADKSFNSDHGYRTALSIPYIMKAQKNAAEKMHCAFWNLFDVMGGQNSMPSWVQKGYAAKDYTHFSVTGSRIIGNLLAKAFLYEYQRPSVAIP